MQYAFNHNTPHNFAFLLAVETPLKAKKPCVIWHTNIRPRDTGVRSHLPSTNPPFPQITSALSQPSTDDL
ncbi:hypothetical protein HRE53_04780 [Acaryochloris sp. 'Moss Beach']|uniref:hypothetical protein n=1 Tax=Acaryochloris sp. 'Moss Beach' TaxID=2740837 RepID=UPI001F4849CB|nr:hypothetical protein [Acaryochloris sp. 'Moss Beach']UJB70426.1 hypothetical protein HRE53_04780 [Acaryochloris sp. 'Moss Beach']